MTLDGATDPGRATFRKGVAERADGESGEVVALVGVTPTGCDGAIGPALLTGAGAVAVAVVAALFAPGRVRAAL